MLELIDALLTTTGCGLGPPRPQLIGLLVLVVNRFVAIIVRNSSCFWLARRKLSLLQGKCGFLNPILAGKGARSPRSRRSSATLCLSAFCLVLVKFQSKATYPGKHDRRRRAFGDSPQSQPGADPSILNHFSNSSHKSPRFQPRTYLANRAVEFGATLSDDEPKGFRPPFGQRHRALVSEPAASCNSPEDRVAASGISHEMPDRARSVRSKNIISH